MKELTSRQQIFVREYALGKNATDAARLAGYSEGYCRRAAYHMPRRPAVKAAMEATRERLKSSTDYDLQQAVGEVDSLVSEARAAKQFTAVSSLLQMKLKLFGMLVDRVHQFHDGPDLVAALAAARERAGLLPPPTVEGAPLLPAIGELIAEPEGVSGD